MPIETRIPTPADVELASRLAGTLARRCAQLALPVIMQHEHQVHGPVSASRQRLMDAADSLAEQIRQGILLSVPSGQAAPLLLSRLDSAPHDNAVNGRRTVHLAIWDFHCDPDPSPEAVVKFMHSAESSHQFNFGIVLRVAGAAEGAPMMDLLDSHFKEAIPLFSCHDDFMTLHYPMSGQIRIAGDHISALLAISCCFKPFRALVEAVRSLEPDEATELLRIFEETFTYTIP